MTGLSQRYSRVAGIIWKTMLGITLLDLGLIALAISGGDSPLHLPGGAEYVAKGIVALLVGGAVFLCLPAQPARDIGTGTGLAGGGLLLVHMGLENFGTRVGENTAVTLAFMLSGFLIWGVGGYGAVRLTGGLGAGPMAGCCGALVGVILAVTFGLILMTANVPAPSYVATWPEFQASGWTNAHAFAIANTLDAVLGHLVVGPLAGTVFGLLGGGVARLTRRGAVATTAR